jgi:hypothetical protein
MWGVQYNDTAKTLICNNLVGLTITNTSCNPNFSLSEVGSRTMWNPVPDLDVGFDVVWYHFNTAFGGGTANLAAAQGAKPPGAYAISDRDALGAVFRIQRNFIY